MFENLTSSPKTVARAVLVTVAVLLACSVATADDRSLLRETGNPYVFVILDTSGSMTETSFCTQEQAMSDVDPFDAFCTSECTLGDAKCAQICPDVGCVDYDLDAIVDPGIEIIMDNGAASFTGTWDSEVLPTGFYGGDYREDQDSTNCQDLDLTNCKSAVYTPGITSAGDYQVYLWWPEDTDGNSDGIGDNFASNVLVDVVHTGGTSTVAMDQRLGGGEWNLVGVYDLDASVGSGEVTVRNENANGIAVADAVRWLKIDIPACLGADVYRCQQPICPLGQCKASLDGDDPRSKLYQARQALYEVIEGVPFAQFGLDSFEQDNPRVRVKHWLYRVSEFGSDGVTPQTPPTLRTTEFLEVDAEEVFGNYSLSGDLTPELGVGDGWECNNLFSDGDVRVGCDATNAADLTDIWETERARRIPKLGREGNVSTAVYYRVGHDTDETFRVLYSPVSGSFGDDRLPVSIEICRWNTGTGACRASNPSPTTTTVYYDLISDYVAVDGSLSRQPMTGGGFFDNQTNLAANDTCQGLDPNDDTLDLGDSTADDTYEGYNIRWPTDTSDPRGSLFDEGDFVPIDPDNSNRSDLLERMAPNITSGGLADSPPDYRSAVYFAADVDVGDDPTDKALRKLRLKDEDERPFVAIGRTPLGESLADFKEWYFGPTASPNDGFSDWAEINDEVWECRDKYVLLLTDGLDTCYNLACVDEDAFPLFCTKFSNEPATMASDLNAGDVGIPNSDVQTYVVGFGLTTTSGSALSAIAANGGTVEPFFPENKDDLVEDLQSIFDAIDPGPRTFASASIPAIQSTAADKIFLSSFSPVPGGAAFWSGRVDAFRQPLPLNDDDEPDIDEECANIDTVSNDLQSACHIWEVGEQLCEQAPDETDALLGNFHLGSALKTERRVFYGQAYEDPTLDASPLTAPRPLPARLFEVPTPGTDPTPPAANPAMSFDTEDLAAGLFPDRLESYNETPPSISPSELAQDILDVIAETVKIKDLTGLDDATREEIRSCDFDSDGLSDGYVMGDIFHANPISLGNPDNFTYFANNIFGYRDFARKHVWRRRMLAVASNDGQLHFYDAGVRQVLDNDLTDNPGDKIELFNDGSGYELFSYIPRLTLPILTEQTGGSQHIFSLDGAAAVGDVYIDPSDPDGGVTVVDREWRSVMIGGMREGGDVDEEIDGTNDAPFFKSGYYALDVTQPDFVDDRDDNTTDPTSIPCPTTSGCDEDDTMPTEYLPSCLDFAYAGDGAQDSLVACEGNPFPGELWTFTDQVRLLESEVAAEDDGDGTNEPINIFINSASSLDQHGMYLDEDHDGIPDLADTWSRPVIGQIQICDGGTDCDPNGDDGDLEALQVAIFGGGFDPERKLDTDVGGNYIYMINVETGKVIYKRQVEGSVVADPALLDINRDGFFDRIYVATTWGRLYKVDLTLPTGNLPTMGSVAIDEDDLLGLSSSGSATAFTTLYPGVTIDRTFDRITATDWEPFEIYNTCGDPDFATTCTAEASNTENIGSPFYFTPVAFYIPEIDQYGVAIGTGDREDLWSDENGEIFASGSAAGGRFIVLVDQDIHNDSLAYDSTMTTACADRLPITADCLTTFNFDDTPDFGADYLLPPAEDDAMGDPLHPGWVMDLGSPDIRVTAEAFVVSGLLIFSDFEGEITDCEQTGTTRAFVLQVKNASPVAPLSLDPSTATDSDYDTHVLDEDDRFDEIDEFTTAPFIDRTATKNPPPSTDHTLLDEINENLGEAVRNSIMDQYPRGSRFNRAFSLVIAALRNSTGVQVYATVPIAVYPADWKDQ